MTFLEQISLQINRIYDTWIKLQGGKEIIEHPNIKSPLDISEPKRVHMNIENERATWHYTWLDSYNNCRHSEESDIPLFLLDLPDDELHKLLFKELKELTLKRLEELERKSNYYEEEYRRVKRFNNSIK